MKDINFNFQLEPQSKLTIEDIGNCSLEAWNELEYLYYIIVKTISGKTYIMEWGPILEDSDKFLNGYKSSLKIMEFNPKKLSTEIWNFLNDKSKKIINASEIELDQALNNFKCLKTFIEEINNGKN